MRATARLFVLLLVASCGSTPTPDASPSLRDELTREYGFEISTPGARRAIRWLEARPELARRLLAPNTVALVRILRDDYGVPFHAGDADELVAWANDAAIRRTLEDPDVRAFARARIASGAVDENALRFRRGRLWSPAVGLFGALARRDGLATLLDELHRLYAYRLDVVDTPGLVRLVDDDALRERLLDERIAAGWRAFAKPSKVRFVPGAAASVVVLARRPDDGEIVEQLRIRHRVRVTRPSSLADLARLAREHEGLGVLVAEDHAELLERLDEMLPRRVETGELPGTLRLAADRSFRADLVEDARRAGWRPVFDSASVDTLLRLAADGPLRARLAVYRPPPDVGTRDAPRSLGALVDAATGAADPLNVWLNDNDLTLRPVLDEGGTHADLVAAVLAAREDRPIVNRADAAHDATGRILHRSNRMDLLKIRVVQRALDDPAFRARLRAEIRADVADEAAERGGLLHLEPDGSLRIETDALAGGDGMHRLSKRPDPKAVFATWHLHALGGERYAGPSTGSVSDLASARRLGVDGIVVTPVEGGMNVDYYDTTGGVLDLGTYE